MENCLESKKIDQKVYISYSLNDMLSNMKDTDLRIIYDDQLEAFLWGDAEEVVHNGLYTAAYNKGYYDHLITPDSDFGYIYDYIDRAEDGYFDFDDNWHDEWSYRLVYAAPNSNEHIYYENDDYRERWVLQQGGYLYMRDGSIYDTPFKDVIVREF